MHICYEPEFSVIDTKDSCPGNGARLKKIGSGAKSDRSEIPKKKKLLISKRTNRVDDLERSGGSDAKDGEKKKKTIMKQLKSIVPRPGRLVGAKLKLLFTLGKFLEIPLTKLTMMILIMNAL